MAGRVLIGISGWRYEPWRGVWYPKGLAQSRELAYASRALPTIEINGTHYSLQRPEYFDAWYRETPPGFVFAVKGSRFITHMKKLRDIERPLANFFAQGLFNLREKLGPLLWQFPEQFRYDPKLIEEFLALLPRDTGEALALARRRDGRVKGRSRLAIDAVRPLRHAMEVRSRTFVDPSFVDQLRRHGVALVVADTAGKWPCAEDVTADFVYVRLHGDEELYVSGYTDEALERWAARIDAWRNGGELADAKRIGDTKARKRKGRDVYCYFDNDVKVHAPFDARTLIGKLEGRAAAATRRRASAPARRDPRGDPRSSAPAPHGRGP